MTNLLFLIELLPYRAFSLETIMFLCTIVLLVLAFLMLYKTKVPDKIYRRTLTGMAVVLISMSTAIFTCFIYNYFYARPQTCSQHDLKMEKQDCLPPLDSVAKVMEKEYENNIKKRIEKEFDKPNECTQNSDSLNNEREKKRENEKEKEIKEEIIEMNSLRRSEQSEHLEIPEYSKFSNEPDSKIAP